METGRRSPLRILAPIALIGFAIALFLIVQSGGSGGGGPAAGGAGQARDLGTGTGAARTRSATTRARDRLPQRTYIVKTGDTLGSIAQKTGIPTETLQTLNPGLDQFALVAGQKIKLR